MYFKVDIRGNLSYFFVELGYRLISVIISDILLSVYLNRSLLTAPGCFNSFVVHFEQYRSWSERVQDGHNFIETYVFSSAVQN